ncbi:MAG TPA: hypothetical protein DEQ28_02860 [Clostridiales bacterium]|nr:hypothetical protein [Clostridiales bacterium]
MVEVQIVKVDERPGFFHKPEWYRPLLFGENMYMNVTYLLPGGPPRADPLPRHTRSYDADHGVAGR